MQQQFDSKIEENKIINNELNNSKALIEDLKFSSLIRENSLKHLIQEKELFKNSINNKSKITSLIFKDFI